jgi:hypothetical protein
MLLLPCWHAWKGQAADHETIQAGARRRVAAWGSERCEAEAVSGCSGR